MNERTVAMKGRRTTAERVELEVGKVEVVVAVANGNENKLLLIANLISLAYHLFHFQNKKKV